MDILTISLSSQRAYLKFTSQVFLFTDNIFFIILSRILFDDSANPFPHDTMGWNELDPYEHIDDCIVHDFISLILCKKNHVNVFSIKYV